MHTLDSTAFRAVAIALDNLSLSVAALVCNHMIDTPDNELDLTILAVDPDAPAREYVMHARVHRLIDRASYHTDNPTDVYSVDLLDADDLTHSALDANACARLRRLASHV
jgi:hypothetical protein